MNIREFINKLKLTDSPNDLTVCLKMLGVNTDKCDRETQDSFCGIAKALMPAIRRIKNDYLLDNYSLELVRDAIFFRFNGGYQFGSINVSGSHFMISVNNGRSEYTVNVEKKDWGNVLETDSQVILTAFLNIYDEYLREQELFYI